MSSKTRSLAGRRQPPATRKVLSRNARFQQWQALLHNRTKRNRTGEFLIQGVRLLTLAVENGWPLRALLRPIGASLSTWATDMVAAMERSGVEVVEVATDLLVELGEKSEGPPELVGVGEIQPDQLERIAFPPDGLVVVLDRPAYPVNIGTLVRSADAFGASGVVVTGHAADVYDPKAVRASTGSLFAVPTIRKPSHHDVMAWLDQLRTEGVPVQVVGTDEDGDVDVDAANLVGPTVVVVGNERRGMSAAWREACDIIVRIPIRGSASSLNASVAASLLCYEADRQRRASRAR